MNHSAMPQKILTLLENCDKVQPEKQRTLVDVFLITREKTHKTRTLRSTKKVTTLLEKVLSTQENTLKA